MLTSKKVTRYLFYAYLILLTWGILFKFETQLEHINLFMDDRHVNWIPFSAPLIVNGEVDFIEMVINLLFFIPLGVCLPLIKTDWSIWRSIALGLLLSLLFESLQFLFAIGMTDVTDVLLNTSGVVLGLIVYHLFVKFLQTQARKWVNVIGVFVVVPPLLILISLFIFGLFN